MKKLFYTIVFMAVTAVSISSCTEDNVKPKDNTTGQGSTDPCQFGGPGCK